MEGLPPREVILQGHRWIQSLSYSGDCNERWFCALNVAALRECPAYVRIDVTRPTVITLISGDWECESEILRIEGGRSTARVLRTKCRNTKNPTERANRGELETFRSRLIDFCRELNMAVEVPVIDFDDSLDVSSVKVFENGWSFEPGKWFLEIGHRGEWYELSDANRGFKIIVEYQLVPIGPYGVVFLGEHVYRTVDDQEVSFMPEHLALMQEAAARASAAYGLLGLAAAVGSPEAPAVSELLKKSTHQFSFDILAYPEIR